jgi:hypothetical protein
VKYAAANMQILTTRGQILSVEVSRYLASYLAVLGWKSALKGQGAAVPRFARLSYLPVSARILAYLPVDLELQTFAYFNESKAALGRRSGVATQTYGTVF